MKPGEWNYQWVKIDDRLHAYIRVRMEETLDGFWKPYTETLNYARFNAAKESWGWHAYKHVGNQTEEMDISSPLLILIQDKIEASAREG